MNIVSSVNNSGNNVDEENEKDKISYLIRKLPVLGNLFHIHGKIGKGTFSSVFLATLKSSTNQRKFAIKHLVPTCHPRRIERELQCLQDIGGTDYVVELDLCLRSAECIVFVMPYMKHDRFAEYVHDMTVDETRNYMKALLVALRRVHKFNIIHRDVKPSNFLYNRAMKQYRLVDFGLAQQYTTESNTSSQAETCVIESQPGKRKRNDVNDETGPVKNTGKPIDVQCICYGKPRICSICLSKSAQTAPRAGTPGFRAPEVLLKFPSQTSAIDIWASGVIMLCILSGTHPFFRSPDDCTALAEITTIFGSTKMQQCAKKLGRKLTFSENIPGIDIKLLCQKLQKRNSLHREEDPNTSCSNKNQEKIDTAYPSAAYDLLIRLLDPDHCTRITAEEAINHTFLAD
ncbi:cell division cycle 7-related protein kinase isoform X1 [Neodiprion pinetum]|uniref:cell division cycle 7-related protein kinase isoform X1 n=1 Tax=Neodiprion pinetum TaxID=441929 RepID=UPI00076FC687|nr:cell division cycle 7-related protein kinase isoform X1 [Neodiprion pinetum]